MPRALTIMRVTNGKRVLQLAYLLAHRVLIDVQSFFSYLH